MKKILIALLRSYQIATSNVAPRCKYYPSCSHYAITAIARYGVRGVAISIWRIIRCNPWSLGGVDYVDPDRDCADVINSIKTEKELVGAN